MKKNKRLTRILIVSVLLSMAACSNKAVKEQPAPIESKAIRLEKRAQENFRQYNFKQATSSAHDALVLYALLDDQQGQLRSHIHLTRLYLLQDKKKKAVSHLNKAQSLAQETHDNSQAYQIHLLTGKLNNDPLAFQQALATAHSNIEKAVVDTYLKKYQQAYDQIKEMNPESYNEEDDYAFVLLQYSNFSKDELAGLKALSLFKKNENTLGISDSLYVLGMIASGENLKEKAEYYYRRALEVNVAMGSKQRTTIIIDKLERLEAN